MNAESAKKLRTMACLFIGLCVIQPALADETANENADLQKYRQQCMQAIENNAHCACMTNALRQHVPAEHLSVHEEHGAKFSVEMSEEAHDAVIKAAGACDEKFMASE